MGSKTLLPPIVNRVRSTEGLYKLFQGPWMFELLTCLAVVSDSSHCSAGLATRTLLQLWLGQKGISPKLFFPLPQFVIHYLLLSCSWQTSLGYGSYCLVSELGPVSYDCLLPVLLVPFFL